ncbi:NUDIX domain-containing protein [Cupriavidus necator]|uniref:NUDIX domain-containing protein n=1 Tax=Cupriavidus necator TaxID=106590 RepID=UPI001E2C3B74|nr:NUDIX domain-containing protein [Cupriavidus necator]
MLVSKDGSKWALPGGRPSKDESFADAAGRELEEETALSAKGLGFLFQVLGPTTVHHVFVANMGKTAVPGRQRRSHVASGSRFWKWMRWS